MDFLIRLLCMVVGIALGLFFGAAFTRQDEDEDEYEYYNNKIEEEEEENEDE